MAIRARLAAPQAPRRNWEWHTVKAATLPASILFGADRRLEADSYLSDGYSIRLLIQKRSGWKPMSDFASVFQPGRLKGTLVSKEYGKPFLAATQIFDIRPHPRKFLAVDQISDLSSLLVRPSTILVTRSGTVGRTTLAQRNLDGVIVSDDLLRVTPRNEANWGWLFAYLRSPSIIRLMQSAHYGHMIKHLEVAHLDAVPVVEPTDTQRKRAQDLVTKVYENRNAAEKLIAEAEVDLAAALGLEQIAENIAPTATVSASQLFGGRRRFEATFHGPKAGVILRHLQRNAKSVDCLSKFAHRIWWMTRFSRNFGDEGTPYMSADELFSIGHVGTKRIYTDPIPNHREFFVEKGWILMACSGQIYGLNGSVTLATSHDENFFFSHDLIRIAPDTNAIRPGYLFTFLGHPTIGQTLVRRVAYGSSIPHLDPNDIADLPVPRLNAKKEEKIADLAEQASNLRAEAAALERQAGDIAEQAITKFIS